MVFFCFVILQYEKATRDYQLYLKIKRVLPKKTIESYFIDLEKLLLS